MECAYGFNVSSSFTCACTWTHSHLATRFSEVLKIGSTQPFWFWNVIILLLFGFLAKWGNGFEQCFEFYPFLVAYPAKDHKTCQFAMMVLNDRGVHDFFFNCWIKGFVKLFSKLSIMFLKYSSQLLFMLLLWYLQWFSHICGPISTLKNILWNKFKCVSSKEIPKFVAINDP
jgi:hypothetical protein